jgi:glutaconate CoA-transferase, subunit B
MMDLTLAAKLAFSGARELKNEDVCFVGIGVPSDAAVLAKHTHAPDMTLIYESGVIGADPMVPPLSTGSPSVADGALMITDGLTVFSELQAGRINVGLLSAAQVDRKGNLNSTVIGPYESPKLRMVGSGGAHDIACLAGRLVIIMPHDPRRFVENVDFITSPGTDAEARKNLGLGNGPSALVTERARFSFETGVARLSAIMPGYSEEDALEDIPWSVDKSQGFEMVSAFPENDIETAHQRLKHLF